MNRPVKMYDLNWRIDNIHEEHWAEKKCSDLATLYPTAEIYYDKDAILDKAYPIYFWFIEIFFDNKEDEAVFILRESQ